MKLFSPHRPLSFLLHRHWFTTTSSECWIGRELFPSVRCGKGEKEIRDFFVDQYEVWNQQFRKFVDGSIIRLALRIISDSPVYRARLTRLVHKFLDPFFPG